MAIAGHAQGRPSTPNGGQAFADLVGLKRQPLSEVKIPLRAPKTMDGAACVVFTKEEIALSAQPFKYSLVSKFSHQQPSLDNIRAFIRNQWVLT